MRGDDTQDFMVSSTISKNSQNEKTIDISNAYERKKT